MPRRVLVVDDEMQIREILRAFTAAVANASTSGMPADGSCMDSSSGPGPGMGHGMGSGSGSGMGYGRGSGMGDGAGSGDGYRGGR